jgi:hypothetical protein
VTDPPGRPRARAPLPGFLRRILGEAPTNPTALRAPSFSLRVGRRERELFEEIARAGRRGNLPSVETSPLGEPVFALTELDRRWVEGGCAFEEGYG